MPLTWHGRASDYGLTIGGAVGVDMKRVKARKDAVSGNSRTRLETRLKRLANCTVYKGHARFETLHDVRVGEELLSADRIFLKLGMPPLAVRGFELGNAT